MGWYSMGGKIFNGFFEIVTEKKRSWVVKT